MNYSTWKYIFLKTAPEYQNALGGVHEPTPYSAETPELVLSKDLKLGEPFDYAGKEYGAILSFDSVGFHSNRIQLKMDCRRKELFLNASKDAVLCVVLEERGTHKNKFYTQFKFNETPSTECCETKEYNYSANICTDFKPGDKLSVFLWNIGKQAFLINKFSVKAYNYNFQIN